MTGKRARDMVAAAARFLAAQALVLGIAACGSATGEPSSANPGGGAGVAGIDAGPDDDGVPAEASIIERPRLAHCVLHAGSMHASSTDGVLQSASCAYNAECFAHPGSATEPTDGFVDLACEWDQCVCTVESAVPGSTPVRFGFRAPEPCAHADLAARLFGEHCMVGMELEDGARPPLRSGDVGTAAPAPHDPERQVRYRGREASGRRGRFRGRTEQTPSTKPQR